MAALISMFLTCCLTSTSEACEPSELGFVCDEQLPAAYQLCPDGCYLVTELRMARLLEYRGLGMLVPELTAQVDRLTQQRDMAVEGGIHAATRARTQEQRAIALQVRLDDAYSLSDILVTGAVGVAVGTVVSLVIWVLL